MSKIKNLPLYASIFVVVIFSIFYFVNVNKISYAFSYNETKESKIVQENLITKCAEIYAENHKDLFKDKDTIYITVQDLIDYKVLPSEDGKIYEAGSNVKLINENKIRISYNEEKFSIKLLKE